MTTYCPVGEEDCDGRQDCKHNTTTGEMMDNYTEMHMDLVEQDLNEFQGEGAPLIKTSTHDRLQSIAAAQGSEFRQGLRNLINRCSLENGCDLADDVIAEYLVSSYLALCKTAES